MKKLLYFLFIIVLTSCFSSEDSDVPYLNNAKTVEEAKKRVDITHKQVLEDYNKLCAGVRNDHVKDEFVRISRRLREYEDFGEDCHKLSTDDQYKVLKYARELIKSSNLEPMLVGEIPCW